ncbi:MAG: hypothetical protein LQ342_005643 [Letrouitia transgressa]|nr:MAG: hypothetical protein LQ342_005643 [Letrouitia transgressa]
MSSISSNLDDLLVSLLNIIRAIFDTASSAIEAVFAVLLNAKQVSADLYRNRLLERLRANKNDLYHDRLRDKSAIGTHHSDASAFWQLRMVSRRYSDPTTLGKASERWIDISKSPKACSFDDFFAARHQEPLNESLVPVTLIEVGGKQRTISGASSQERSKASTQNHTTLLAKSPGLADESKSPYQGDEDMKTLANPKILLRIPRSQYPLRVNNTDPPADPLEIQMRTMRWRHNNIWHRWVPQVCWLVEPSIETIAKVAKPYIDSINNAANIFEVEFLMEGGFNKVYMINIRDEAGHKVQRYIFRIASPVDPYYKTECEVATMEFIRYSSDILVPIVYAYDSSSDNLLGFEWILMEEVKGKPLYDLWDTFNYDIKVRLTKQVAEWATQISQITSNQIGGIYMRFTADETEFYVGRSVHWGFRYHRRLSYDIPRGPFDSLHDFFKAILTAAKFELDEIKKEIALEPEKYTLDALLDVEWVDFKDPLILPSDFDKDFEEQRKNMYKQADEDDKQDFMAREIVKPRNLKWMSYGLEDLLAGLEPLCSEMEPLSTRLSHADMSMSNLFVNDNGVLVGLIDWEHIQFGPLLSISQIPTYLQGEDRPESPSICGLISDNEEEIAQKLQECTAEDRDFHLRHLNEYWQTKLRKVYQEELKVQGSPLVDAATEELYFELDLFNRITEPWEDIFTTPDFVESFVEWETGTDKDSHGEG